MSKGRFGLDNYPEIVAFGKEYVTGLGLSLEEIAFFYLYAEHNMEVEQVAELLHLDRLYVRKKIVGVFRELFRAWNRGLKR